MQTARDKLIEHRQHVPELRSQGGSSGDEFRGHHTYFGRGIKYGVPRFPLLVLPTLYGWFERAERRRLVDDSD